MASRFELSDFDCSEYNDLYTQCRKQTRVGQRSESTCQTLVDLKYQQTKSSLKQIPLSSKQLDEHVAMIHRYEYCKERHDRYKFFSK